MTTSPGTIELHELVLPSLANHHGTLFAGHGLQLMAKASYLAARSLARASAGTASPTDTAPEVVMAGVSAVAFLEPIPVGQALSLQARVTRVGRCSMTVSVTGRVARSGQAAAVVLTGEFEMVAVDARGRPSPIDTVYLNKESIE